MSKFIQLIDKDTESPIVVNSEHILKVTKSEDYETLLFLTDGSFYTVEESIKTIQARIEADF
jgi:hypothetical protein